MASIHSKPSGAYIVRWRVKGKLRGKQFKSRAQAEEFKAELERDAVAREVLSSPGIPGWDEGMTFFPAEDEAYALGSYINSMVEADRDLRDTTRSLYLRNLRLHIADTDLGRTDIRNITPGMLRDWWAKLDAGVGARRNVTAVGE